MDQVNAKPCGAEMRLLAAWNLYGRVAPPGSLDLGALTAVPGWASVNMAAARQAARAGAEAVED